ncbi:MAG: hypothetical protein ACI8SJ_000044 [Shewanella sp.]|jgi:hypothetical protein
MMKNITLISFVISASGLLALSIPVNAKVPLEGEPEWEARITEQQRKAQLEKERLELLIKKQAEQESKKDKQPIQKGKL